MAVDKGQLIGASEAEYQTVEIPGKGEVTVKKIRRTDAVYIYSADTLEEQEVRLIERGMHDPELNHDEAVAWQENGDATELAPAITAILQLAGLAKTDKERGDPLSEEG